MKTVKFGLMGVALASIFAIAESAVSLGEPVAFAPCDDTGACKDSGMSTGCSKSEGSTAKKCTCKEKPGGSILTGLYYCHGILAEEEIIID
jgi:hypothetical protein